jgi:thioredoxin reductase
MSKSILDTAVGGTFMSKEVEEGTKLLDDMQNNNSQWNIERSYRKVNSIHETKNEERFVVNVNEILGIIKGN